jgi:hypothetical protein
VSLSLLARNATESGISATAVRTMILQDADNLKDCVPTCVYEQRNTIKNLIELSKLKG